MVGAPQSATGAAEESSWNSERRMSATAGGGVCDILSPAGLIGADDPPPVSVVNSESDSPVVFLCDHAGNHIPGHLANLGVKPADLERHIAFDPGAAALARGLADRFRATALFANYSRLIVDPNRGLDHVDLFWRVSDGTVVPGNQGLTAEQRAQRLAAYYWPYHRRVAAEIDRRVAAGVLPAVIGIHTFTPALHGEPPRPWHVGVLWQRDGRIAVPLIQRLRLQGTLCVGDNEPYSGRDYLGGSMERHAIPAGLPHVVIEVRNDLLVRAEGVRRWVGLLGAVLEPVLATLAIDCKAQVPLAAE